LWNGINIATGTQNLTSDIFITDNVCVSNGNDGIAVDSCSRVFIERNTCWNNSAVIANSGSGIAYDYFVGLGPYSRIHIKDNTCYDTTGSGQKRGITVTGAANITNSKIQGNSMWGHATSEMFVDWTDASNVIKENDGWITENSGTSSIVSGGTAVSVTHGLSITPTVDRISIMGAEDPTNSVGTIFISAISSSAFTVSCENDPGASNFDFGWRVS
jgi:hypothetical protein